MEGEEDTNQRGSEEAEERGKLAAQDMRDGIVVVEVRLLKKGEVADEGVGRPFILFDELLHLRSVRGEVHALAVVKPYVVVWRTFQELDAFRGHGGAEICKGGVEERREEEE